MVTTSITEGLGSMQGETGEDIHFLPVSGHRFHDGLEFEIPVATPLRNPVRHVHAVGDV